MGAQIGLWWALFMASVKMFVRNRTALFFSLFLPLVIMLIFGVLNFEGSTSDQPRESSTRQITMPAPRSSTALARVRLPRDQRGDRARRSWPRSRTGTGASCSSSRPVSMPQLGGETGLVAYASTSDPSQAQVGAGPAAAGRRRRHRIGLGRSGGSRTAASALRSPSSRSSRATSATSTSWCRGSSA